MSEPERHVFVPEPYYPESDGLPMAETDVHRGLMMDLHFALAGRYAGRDDAYVGANMLMYYVQGDPHQSVAPDVFLVLGRPPGDRLTWKVWEEDGRAPDLVFEISSPSTKANDLGAKKGLYEYLGVREYVLYDPLRQYLRPHFQLFRLVDGLYREAVVDLPAHSLVTGLDFREHGGTLRLWDPDAEALLRTAGEERERAEAERERADRAEAEVERLRRELEGLGRG